LKRLDCGDTMRIVICAVVALRLSVQTSFPSLLFGVLGVKREPRQ
jgi:hypothetical protein